MVSKSAKTPHWILSKLWIDGAVKIDLDLRNPTWKNPQKIKDRGNEPWTSFWPKNYTNRTTELGDSECRAPSTDWGGGLFWHKEIWSQLRVATHVEWITSRRKRKRNKTTEISVFTVFASNLTVSAFSWELSNPYFLPRLPRNVSRCLKLVCMWSG